MTWTTRCCCLLDVRRCLSVVRSCALTVFEEHFEIGFLRFAVGVLLLQVNGWDDALVVVVVAATPGMVFRRRYKYILMQVSSSQSCLKALL